MIYGLDLSFRPYAQHKLCAIAKASLTMYFFSKLQKTLHRKRDQEIPDFHEMGVTFFAQTCDCAKL